MTLARCNDDQRDLARSRRRSSRKLPDGSRKGRCAFTLVELLVVVAIIALLVSILLPTLNKAKDQAKAVVCSTRLKGIMLATLIYTHQYNGWAHASYGNTIDYGGDGKSWYGAMIDEELLPEPYDSELSHCPLTNVAPWLYDSFYGYGMRAPYWGNHGPYGSGYFKIDVACVRCRRGVQTSFTYEYCPADFIIYMDCMRWMSSLNAWTQWYTVLDDKSLPTYWEQYLVDPRHSGAANCAFADGHVEPVRRDRLNELGFNDENILLPEP